jgi:hypothetical protein
MNNYMRVLISFCNPSLRSKRKNLLLYDFQSEKGNYLLNRWSSCTGLAQDKDYFYAVSHIKVIVKLLVLRKSDNSIVCEKVLRNVSDVHSITVNNKKIYIVSSGTDSVVEYEFDPLSEKINFVKTLWTIPNPKALKDTHHINSVFFYKGDIYVSAFGKKEGLRWSTAKHGYIKNISSNENKEWDIYHPHSLFIEKEKFYYCESALSRVKRDNETIAQLESGYIRGLCLNGDFLVFGVSESRGISKSTGLLNKKEGRNFLSKSCKIFLYKRKQKSKGYIKIKEMDLFPKHAEIYDIMLIS